MISITFIVMRVCNLSCKKKKIVTAFSQVIAIAFLFTKHNIVVHQLSN